MTTASLNLARKWRSKKFEQIVGQDLSVKILRNSLYKGAFFPVYLFAGQRGCGKTSTARVFATALNCEKLSEFQKNPRAVSLPCLACNSCASMISGRHPDFFEIDAASHTGVDNVRQILDASTLMPLMGRLKVYLIDEAHMLSKASFNAFLKILEEPPDSVLFILATTDPQKIIETVRSRCLQLYFKPIEANLLVDHLKQICEQEGIRSELDGLKLIVQESQGSARDALNMLEQVRFASSTITVASVQRVLGHCNKEFLVQVLRFTFCGAARDLLLYMEEQKLSSFSHDHLWSSLVQLIRTVVWLKHGVKVNESEYIVSKLKEISSACPLSELVHALKLFYHNESIASRVTSKYVLLEMILLQILQRRNNTNNSGNVPPVVQKSNATATALDCEEESSDECASKWNTFLSAINTIENPLVQSVFTQGEFLEYVSATKKVRIGFSEKLQFFQDWIVDSKSVWLEHLRSAFGAGVDLEVEFNESIVYKESSIARPVVSAKPTSTAELAVKPEPPRATPQYQRRSFSSNKNSIVSWEKTFNVKKVGTLDVASDKDKWKLANTILEHFPGDIYEISERSA